MRNSIAVILLIVFFIGCKPTVPSEYIQPDDLEDILYDYHVSQAIVKESRYTSGNSNTDNDYQKNVNFLAVLKKHGVTEAVFDSSLVYYYSHADKLKSIYERVHERLNDEAKALGASVGDISRYSTFSSTGDTANVWKNETDILLMSKPTVNRFDIHVEADTSYYKGDTFMFQFMADYVQQSGSRDAIVCMVAKYEGDSITQTITHISTNGQTQMRIPPNREGKLKELNGFIYLNNSDPDTDVRKLLFISQIQLIRFHQKEKKEEPDNEENKKDSVLRTSNNNISRPDTTGGRDVQRAREKVLSAGKGTPLHRMDSRKTMPERK